MDQNSELRAQLNEAKAGGHFVFLPSPLPKTNHLLSPVLEIVKLKPDDFYNVQGSYGIRHHAAMRLASAAGVKWSSEYGSVGRMDDGRNPNFCNFRVAGTVLTAYGTSEPFSAHKHIDLDAKRPALEEKYRKQHYFKTQDKQNGKGKGPWPPKEDDYVRMYVERDLNQIRETMDERCESGAQTRLIRNALHLPVSFKGYKDQYGNDSHDGVAKLFYIVRFAPNTSDEHVRRIQYAAFAQATLGIFGVTTAQQPPMISHEDKGIEPGEQAAGPQEEALDPEIVDFENSDPEEQTNIIRQIVQTKAYPHFDRDMKGSAPLVEWEQEARTDYLKHIKSWRPK